MTSVPAQHVLKQQAYILFYSKVQAVRSIPEKKVAVAAPSHAAPSVKSATGTVSGTVSSSVSSAVSVSGEKRVAVNGPSHVAPSVKSVSSSSASPVSLGISPSRTSSDSFFSSSKKTVIQQPVSRSSQHVVAVAGSRADPPHAGPSVPLQHSSERRVITIKSPVVNGFATLSSVTQVNVSCSKASNSNILKSSTGDCKGAPFPSTVPQMKKQKHQPCNVLKGDGSAEGSEFDQRSRISNGSSNSTASTTLSSSSAEKISSNGTHLDDMRKRKREVRLKTIGSNTRRSRYLSPPFRYVRNIPDTAYAIP